MRASDGRLRPSQALVVWSSEACREASFARLGLCSPLRGGRFRAVPEDHGLTRPFLREQETRPEACQRYIQPVCPRARKRASSRGATAWSGRPSPSAVKRTRAKHCGEAYSELPRASVNLTLSPPRPANTSGSDHHPRPPPPTPPCLPPVLAALYLTTTPWPRKQPLSPRSLSRVRPAGDQRET